MYCADVTVRSIGAHVIMTFHFYSSSVFLAYFAQLAEKIFFSDLTGVGMASSSSAAAAPRER